MGKRVGAIVLLLSFCLASFAMASSRYQTDNNLLEVDNDGKVYLSTAGRQELVNVQMEMHSPGWVWWGQNEAFLAGGYPKKVGNGWHVKGELIDPVSGNSLVYTQIVEEIPGGLNLTYTLEPKGEIKLLQGYVHFWIPGKLGSGRFLKLGSKRISLAKPEAEQEIELGSAQKTSFAEIDLLRGKAIITPQFTNYNWGVRAWEGTGTGLRLGFTGERELKAGEKLTFSYSIEIDEQSNIKTKSVTNKVRLRADRLACSDGEHEIISLNEASYGKAVRIPGWVRRWAYYWLELPEPLPPGEHGMTIRYWGDEKSSLPLELYLYYSPDGHGKDARPESVVPSASDGNFHEYYIKIVSPAPIYGLVFKKTLESDLNSVAIDWIDLVPEENKQSAALNYTPVDIRSVVNMGLADEVEGDQKGGWMDQGTNDLRNLPVGKQTFRGIPFEIIDPASNNGKAALVMYSSVRPYFPKQATISIGAKAGAFTFLHAAAWCPAKGTVVANYKLRYTDGSEEVIPIRSEVEVNNWWYPKDTGQCVVAWRGTNPACSDIGVNAFILENPYPDKEIKELVIEPTGKGVLGIVAITFSDGVPQFSSSIVSTDTEGWIPYKLATNIVPGSALDLSNLLPKPSGKHGFLTVKNDQFLFEDGTVARFWGTANSMRANFPTHQQAEIIAQRLARSGCNIVRLHHMDFFGYGQSDWNIFDREPGPLGEVRLSPERMDRLDYFISKLKENGIYVYMDLLVTRKFHEAEGIRDTDKLWEAAKPISMFNPEMIKAQQDYMQALLLHKNPYTGLRYVDDPTVAMMEIINETSLLVVWSWELADSWPQYYKDELFKLWNNWLVEKYGTQEALRKAWTDENGDCSLTAEEDLNKLNIMWAKSLRGNWQLNNSNYPLAPSRVLDTARFLMEMELKYFCEMTKYLKGLGVKVPIAGSNNPQQVADIRANTYCDFIDNHTYYDHPADRNPWLMHNQPLVKVNQPESTTSVLKWLSNLRVTDKPFFVSEWDFVWPAEHRLEGQIMMAAYAAYQGWNGLTRYSYSHNGWDNMEANIAGPISDSWNYWLDPCVWGQWPASALIFLRGDVKPSPRKIDISFSLGDTLTVQEDFFLGTDWLEKGFLMYQGRLGRSYFDNVYQGDADLVISSGYTTSGDYSKAKHALLYSTNPWPDGYRKQKGQFILPDKGELLDPIAGRQRGLNWLAEEYSKAKTKWGWAQDPVAESGSALTDTGELCFNHQQGLFTLDTPRSQSVVGFINAQFELSSIKLNSTTSFAAVTVNSLDEAAISTSKRILITAVGRAENTGQKWTEDKRTLLWPGSAPIVMDPVEAELLINRKLAPEENVTCYALAADGSRLNRVPVSKTEAGFTLALSKTFQTIYYEIVIQ